MQTTNKINGHDADDPRFRIRPYQQVFSSVAGALTTSLLMTPMDVVKTRLQVQEKLMLSSKCYLYCNGLMDHICKLCGPTGSLITSSQRYRGTLDAFFKISQNEGVKTLWSGLSPTLFLALPTTVLYFVAYEQLRVGLKDLHMNFQQIQNPEEYSLPMMIPLLAGCTARSLAVTIVSPLELIRTKMQSEKMTYSEIRFAFSSLLQQYGFRGLFKGLQATIVRDVPFSGIYWTAYETYKRFRNIPQPNFFEAFLGGGLSGCIAATITCPFDVIKTHQQIEFGEKFLFSANGNGNGNQKQKKMTGSIQTMRNIMRSSGIKGFYAGLIPRLFKVITACAVMISTYEYGKSFFHEHNVNNYYAKHPEDRLN